ncbi:MAG: hypothetical protein EBT07_01475 [Actinobacteria bacterium]|nr:hypothetical protein [Actinomycetota bacterium]
MWMLIQRWWRGHLSRAYLLYYWLILLICV